MPAKNPRLMITVDSDIYSQIKELAKYQGISLSLMARDLIKKAIEWEATFEILSDKKMMQIISDSLKEIKSGKKGTPWRKVLK